jgi:hypothetical protein
MTPKEKADKLCMRFLIQTTTDIPYGINKTIAKECALIAVDEILETTKVKWSTQRKLPNGEYKLWKGVAYKKYWQEVNQEIQNL